MSVKLTGLGACQEVGRSSFLLDTGDKIIMDRGIKISSEETEYPLPIPTNIDAAVISHAHLDHSGDLPSLFVKGNPLCYMTPPTLEVAEILWRDTLKIAGFEGIEASFSKDEIERAKQYTFSLPYRKQIELTQKTKLEFFDAGHILGSALTRLDFDGKSLLYTGDFNASDTRLHSAADLDMDPVNYIITESTYGDREHPNRADTEKMFVDKIREGLDNGGTVVIPAFAVGRAQEVLDILNEYKINAPIYLDGMGQKVARASLRHPTYFRDFDFLRDSIDQSIWIKRDADRKKALKQPAVIVTTAGMLSGGPVQYYIRQIHDDPNSKILMTGFQVEGTPGNQLLQTGQVTLEEEDYTVSCEYLKFDFSAHAGQKDLFKTFDALNPEKIVMVHGDPKVIEKLGLAIEEKLGIPAIGLKLGETVKLDA